MHNRQTPDNTSMPLEARVENAMPILGARIGGHGDEGQRTCPVVVA